MALHIALLKTVGLRVSGVFEPVIWGKNKLAIQWRFCILKGFKKGQNIVSPVSIKQIRVQPSCKI